MKPLRFPVNFLKLIDIGLQLLLIIRRKIRSLQDPGIHQYFHLNGICTTDDLSYLKQDVIPTRGINKRLLELFFAYWIKNIVFSSTTP
ncbi:hypothetical protein D3C86_1746450 [compost metagenome]